MATSREALDGTCYFDRAGEPISLDRFLELSDDPSYWTIDVTPVVERKRWVCTSWLGINYNRDPDGPPLIFETVIFAALDADTKVADLPKSVDRLGRFSTEEEARAGHQWAVEYARGELT